METRLIVMLDAPSSNLDRAEGPCDKRPHISVPRAAKTTEKYVADSWEILGRFF